MVRILAYACGREVTHVVIWFLSPLLLMAGVPLKFISLFWALGYIFGMAGSRLAQHFGHKMGDRQKLLLPVSWIIIGASVLVVKVNLVTIWFYLLFNLTQGWTGAILIPMVQKYADPSEETTTISLAKIVSQFLYIPAVYAIGVAADYRTNLAMVVVLLIFGPASLVISSLLGKNLAHDQ